jgi:hypothetical protein
MVDLAMTLLLLTDERAWVAESAARSDRLEKEKTNALP